MSDDKTQEAPEGAEDVTTEQPVAGLDTAPAAEVAPEPVADVVAAPEPVADVVAAPEPVVAPIAPEPTPTVSAAEATWSRPAGSAAPPPVSPSPSGDALADRPEVLVGAAFAGGLVIAMILKRLGR